MRVFALAAAACLGMAGQAEAAIIRYDYKGQMMYYNETGGIYGYLIGGLTIDESLLPGGSLAGATIYAETLFPDVSGYTRGLYSFTTADGEIYSGRVSWDEGSYPDWSVVGIVSYDPSMVFLYSPIGFYSRLDITFGSDLSVVRWWGDSATGGSTDPRSFGPDGYDYTDDARSYGPGTWTVDVTPSPVPLPAAAPLLLAGTASIFAISRRRQRVSDR